ncbi:STAS domain-containing protein [Streptomyces sp. enrichment culture]|uniref:STAS domain-containing protein n=1 Tax=Streptomyces sp. enrichment culture TaxID=1795815 RepID=UPI003F573985
MGDEQMVTVREGSQAFVLEVTGEIDVDTVDALEEGMARAWEVNAPVTVVDLSHVRFADSSLLNLLLEARARYGSAGRRLAVAGPFHDAVRRLFDLTGTAGHLPLTEDVATAVRGAAADTDGR